MARLAGPHAVPARGASVRLTRRGRVLLLASSAAVLFAALSLGRVASQAATTAQQAPRLGHVVVRPGETLWQVATDVKPSADPRIVVEELMTLNHLTSARVLPGETLLLPAN